MALLKKLAPYVLTVVITLVISEGAKSYLLFKKTWGNNDDPFGRKEKVIFDDMLNTTGYFIVVKNPLTDEQVQFLRNAGVRVLFKPDPQGYKPDPRNENVYFSIIDKDKLEAVRKLDFVDSLALPSTK